MNALLAIAFVLIVYDPWFMGVARGFLIAAALIAPMVIARCKAPVITRGEGQLLLMLLGFTAFAGVPAVLHATGETGVLAMYIKAILYFITALLLVRVANLRQAGVDFCRLLVLSIYLQTVLYLLAIFLPSLQKILLSVHSNVAVFVGGPQEYRLYFFTSSAFFQLSILFGFAFNFLLQQKLEGRVGLLPILCCVILGIASGRSFAMYALIVVVLALAYSRNWKLLFVCVAISAGVIAWALQNADNTFVYYAFEPLMHFMDTGEVSTSSSDALLKRHLYFPGWDNIGWGSGLYYNEDGSYFGHTDSGFLRQILYGGVPYLLMCTVAYLWLLWQVALRWFDSPRFFFLSSVLCLCVFHIKADVSMYPAPLLTLLFILALSQGIDRVQPE